MPSKFDKLPLDVIKYEILPFVKNDYFARMGINSMLQPVERTSTPLRKNAAAELDMALTMMNYKKKGLYAEGGLLKTSAQRLGRLIAIFNFNIYDLHFIKYNKNFRGVITEKAEHYANPNINEYEFVSEDEKANLILNAAQMLEVLSKNPYVCEAYTSVINDKWTPIDGVKPRIIVDNKELLEKIRRSKPHWRIVEEKRKRWRPRRNISDSDYSDEEYDDEHGKMEYGYFLKDNTWVALKVGNDMDN
jgi:hypothetical protein